MGKWALTDPINPEDSLLSFGQLSFGVPDVRSSDDQGQVSPRSSTSIDLLLCSFFPDEHR